MFLVDTNVLIYAADEDSAFHSRCYDLLQEWRTQTSAWFTTWGTFYEFLRVSTHSRVFRTPWSATRAWSFVEALLASPGLGILIATDRHAAVAAEVIKDLPFLSGNLMHDTQLLS